MNDELNCGLRSLMTFLGSPWSLKTRSIIIRAVPCAVRSLFTGFYIAFLRKWLIITRIVFHPFDSGNGPIMSQEISSHGQVGIVFGCNGAVFLPWLALVL